MPGGNKNIKPEDGKQFSSEYQPPEKWTEEKAIELGEDLIMWMKAGGKNSVFFEEFLVITKGLYPELIAYLAKKFSSFFKLLEKAKKIQEIKLMKYGVLDATNAPMTKFTLINHHNWEDKKQVEKTVKKKRTKEELAAIIKKAGFDPTKLEY